MNPTSPDEEVEDTARPPLPTPSQPWWGRISLLYLMSVPVLSIVYNLFMPIAPNDFWYHARVGQVIVDTGRIPTTNLFSSSLPANAPYFYQSWLAEVLFYKTLQWWGLQGMMIERSLCIGLAFALLGWAGYRRAWRIVQAHLSLPGAQRQAGAPRQARINAAEEVVGRLAAAGMLLAFGISALNMEVRPQIYSVPLFAIFVAVAIEWPRALGYAGRLRAGAAWLPFCLALSMLIWANTHGAFATGLVVALVLAVGEIGYAALARSGKARFWWGEPAPARALYWLAGAALLCFVAASINPRGLALFWYVKLLTTNEPSQKYILEWRTPDLKSWTNWIFYASPLLLLLAAALGARARRAADAAAGAGSNAAGPAGEVERDYGALGIRAAELLVLAALLVMALRNVRATIWFGLFLAPLFTSCAGVAWLRRNSSRIAAASENQASGSSMARVNLAMAVLLCLLIVPALPRVKIYIPLPDAFVARFAPNPRGIFPYGFSSDPPLLLDRTTPVEAVRYLQKHPPAGKLYTDMVAGSYINWQLYPAIKSSADPRVEMFPDQFWAEYMRMSKGPADAAATLERLGYSDALLDAHMQRPLARRLEQAGWQAVHGLKGPYILVHYAPPARAR